MDNFESLYDREDHFDVFTDLLFNVLLGFAFMFFIAFVLINPDPDAGKVDTDAEFLITVTWPDSHPDDIDIYVEDPAGNLVWYHVKESGLMNLERDDRGNYKDVIVVNGERIINPLNQETVSIRGFIGGEYIVNIFHYLATSPDPVEVAVKVQKVNPRVEVVFYAVLSLDHTGDEKTAVRFTVNAEDGTVTNVNTRAKGLVRSRNKAGRR
jgi:hypothetical protein